MKNGINCRLILEIIAVLLAAGAIVAAYNIYLWSKTVKAMEIIVDTSSPLVTIQPEDKDNIQIFYNWQLIQNPQLLVLEIKNSGNVPIIAGDYTNQLEFDFGPQDEIKGILVKSKPSTVGMKVSYINNQAIATSTLLNPGDDVTVRFIINETGNTNIFCHLAISGRIVGIKDIALLIYNRPKTCH